jgi:methylated-DNA-protein-cysteine methyltransferase-like protein
MKRKPSRNTGGYGKSGVLSAAREERAAELARKHPSCRKIYQTVARIPRGRVASYAQVAAAAGFQRGARLAGWALHHTPPELKIPWHRVINAQGRISFPPRSEPYRVQRERLEAEGVVFLGGGVDFGRYGWKRRSDLPLLD